MAQDASGGSHHRPVDLTYLYTPSERRPRKTPENCQCPACLGLQCLERPRYFAGQLLTDAELNSEQAYVIAKNRLHNRYLHGWGIVCGLEVVCHNCEGWVNVRAGYALDPCGNDIVVCRDTSFDVLGAIQKCIDAKRRYDDCPPWRDPNDDCREEEQHWCITLQYVENEGRAVMPLQESKSHCGCGGKCGGGCDCGGNSHGHGNGNGKKSSGCSCSEAPKASSKKPSSCEPTRIFEQFRLGVVPEPEECASRRKRKIELQGGLKRDASDHSSQAHERPLQSYGNLSRGLLNLGMFIPEAIREHRLFPALVMAAPDESIFIRALNIGREVNDFLSRRFSSEEIEALQKIALICRRMDSNVHQLRGGASNETDTQSRAIFTDAQSGTGAASPFYELCCKLRRAIRDLYAQNPLNIRCEPFDCPPCTEPQAQTFPQDAPHHTATGTVGTGTDANAFTTDHNFGTADPNAFMSENPATTGGAQSIAGTFCCLFDALSKYVADAICMLFLPSCPPPPCEDRIILACVTIKDKKIVHICNHACRHYAGSFNSVQHWLSALPVIPLIGSVLRDFCCSGEGINLLFGGRVRPKPQEDKPSDPQDEPVHKP